MNIGIKIILIWISYGIGYWLGYYLFPKIYDFIDKKKNKTKE
jgi:hypothetical protein